jgi:acyl-CoA synthetase (AMP-forming)/AMP-acid ligase II
MPTDLFAEFEHKAPEDLPSGDVKYHQGFSSDISTPGGPVHLSLAFNPSHLEIVNPVVEGSARARMERRGDLTGSQVLPVLVHGDAAIAGQGVMQETLAMAEVRGYSTGGTIHIVINNQIGFTTSDPRDLRSSLYCTDIMKVIDAPVLHVNGDDPEAVVLATQWAVEFRSQFKKDVAIDIVCFRKLGHNEQDSPAMTQPLMYKIISAHPGTRKLYAEKLEAQGVVPTGTGDLMVKGPWVIAAYYKQEGESPLVDGWFPTGDVATIDADGFMQITDRSKDVIKSGGEWISSIDIENIAMAHPAVAMAACIGMRHPKWDERPIVCVVKKPGAELTREALIAFYEGKTAKWQIPDDVVFVEAIPLGGTGKMLKTRLREQLASYVLPHV